MRGTKNCPNESERAPRNYKLKGIVLEKIDDISNIQMNLETQVLP